MHALPCSCASGKGSPDEYYFNPLKCPLPRAPSMQMFCLYGTSIDTERSYYYLNLESNKARIPCPSLPTAVLISLSTTPCAGGFEPNGPFLLRVHACCAVIHSRSRRAVCMFVTWLAYVCMPCSPSCTALACITGGWGVRAGLQEERDGEQDEGAVRGALEDRLARQRRAPRGQGVPALARTHSACMHACMLHEFCLVCRPTSYLCLPAEL